MTVTKRGGIRHRSAWELPGPPVLIRVMREHPFFRLSGGFPLLLLGLALAGCATAPDADRLIDAALSKAGQPSVNGNRGPLSAGQSKAILDRIQRRAPGDSEFAETARGGRDGDHGFSAGDRQQGHLAAGRPGHL